MKRIITQNDLMMFIIENNIVEEYKKESDIVILFDFKDGNKSRLIDLNSFIRYETSNTRYIFTNIDIKPKNGITRYVFNFRKE